MDFSSSIYLFLKSNIKGNNKARRSSDTVLCNSDLYKTEREILKEMRLSDLSSGDFEDTFFDESLISRMSLSYSHNSLTNQSKCVDFDLNDNHFLKNKTNKRKDDKICPNQISKTILFNEIDPAVKTLSKSAILSFYNSLSNKNSLQVPNIDLPCKLPFKLKSNVNSRKSSLIEEKQSNRRFKSAPNNRRKQDQPAVFSISSKEKCMNGKLPFKLCKMCNSNRNVLNNNGNN